MQAHGGIVSNWTVPFEIRISDDGHEQHGLILYILRDLNDLVELHANHPWGRRLILILNALYDEIRVVSADVRPALTGPVVHNRKEAVSGIWDHAVSIGLHVSYEGIASGFADDGEGLDAGVPLGLHDKGLHQGLLVYVFKD